MRRRDNNGGLGTLLVGALVGAAAVIISDDRLRNKTLDFLEKKKDDAKRGLENTKDKSEKKVRETKRKALDKAEKGLTKAKSKVQEEKEKEKEVDEETS